MPSKITYGLAVVMLIAGAMPAKSDFTNCVLNMSDFDNPEKPTAGIRVKPGSPLDPEVLGVIHRATKGVDGTDGAYKPMKEVIVRRSVLWGAYHFGRQDENPIQQADFFLATVFAHRGRSLKQGERVLLVLDLEEYRPLSDPKHRQKARFMSGEDAARFVERVHEQTGAYPGIYADEDFLKEHLRRDQLTPKACATLGRCWLWVARWGQERFPKIVSPWKHWQLWQYTADGYAAGRDEHAFPTRVPSMGLRKAELNMFNGSRTQLTPFWTNNGWDYRFRVPLPSKIRVAATSH